MPVHQLVPIPFLLDFQNLQIDKVIIFIASVLAAVTVNAEGQAVMATMLGDIQKDSKSRFHFNPFLHLDLSGLLCFAVAGFGWPRPVLIEPKNFKYPYSYNIIARFAGPLANLFLGGIAGSIVWIMKKYGLEDQVFSIVISVNLMVFAFSFLPIYPLAGASLLSFVLPQTTPPLFTLFAKVFPYLFVLVLFALKLSHLDPFSRLFHPIVLFLYRFLVE